MTYIYDILLNFNNELYEFYDWNKDDRIIHVKKIPIYKVSEKALKEIFSGIVTFDSYFLKFIENKTEVYLKHEVKNVKYSCLLCTEDKVIAVNLNECGKIIEKSDLLIDEHNEVLSVMENREIIDVNYIVEKRNDKLDFSTRLSKEKNDFITKVLNKFNDEELQYIYYEFFLENEESREIILQKINQISNQEQLYKLVKTIDNKYKKIK